MKMNNTVKGATYVREYTVRVVFGDGYAAEVDLRGLFADRPGSLVQELRDTGRFRELGVLNGTLTFGNGYDICPDVLRFFCERGRVVDQPEVDTYFADALAEDVDRAAGRVAEARSEYATGEGKDGF